MRLSVLAAAIACTAMGATTASALTISQQNSSDVFDGGGRAYVSNISNLPGVTGLAGGFRVTDQVTNFIAWCLDVGHYLNLPGTYNVTDTPYSDGPHLGTTQIANIERLFDIGYSNTILSDNAKSGGFQLALWELVYETGAFGVNDGTWHATSSTPGAVSYANTLLSEVINPLVAASQHFKLTFYQADSSDPRYGQNLVSATPVPLPAAGGLLALSLLGLYSVSRRKRIPSQS